jgi:hypothetical protein
MRKKCFKHRSVCLWELWNDLCDNYRVSFVGGYRRFEETCCLHLHRYTVLNLHIFHNLFPTVPSLNSCRVRFSVFVTVLCIKSDSLRTGRPRGRSSSPGRVKSSSLALGSTQLPIQWVPWALSPEVKRRGLKLTTHLQLVLRLRKCGSINPVPHTP